MSLEREIKLQIDDPVAFRRKLEMLRPTLLQARHFENNIVLDFEDGRIRALGSLIRLRVTGDKSILTFKGTPLDDPSFKTREELETEVADAEQTLKILARLGLIARFRYQKFRELFEISSPDGHVHVSLDETPVGIYAELEGTEKGIRWAAAALGYSETDFVRDSYYSLFVRWRDERALEQEHMLFEMVDGN
jgi:adenylate cyclase class 2